MKKILVICGATATGKTSLAVNIAKRINTEVVSADSQLIYRGLNIGTAKPTAEEMQGVKHHMIDIVSPSESYSVADYRSNALPIIENLLSCDKIPVVCGGTGFYINSLLFKLSYGCSGANDDIRNKYKEILFSKGKEYLFDFLKSVDAESAEKLHPNDTKRVIRALEIFEASGKKKSEQKDELTPLFEYAAIAVDFPRAELYERIEKRVDAMFEQGLVEEVISLLKSGVNENCQSMQAIGYKEVVECLKNGKNESTMRDIIKQNTRRYAKRQITFFKRLPKLTWIKPEETESDRLLELLT